MTKEIAAVALLQQAERVISISWDPSADIRPIDKPGREPFTRRR
jgi:hypothetical protein